MVDKQSHRVAEGGFWNNPKPSYSSETQTLMKTLMQESRLTNFQQRQLSKAMQDGRPLPNNCHPTSSAKPRTKPKKKPQSKVLNPRNYSSHTRSREQIEASGAYEREKFHPSPQLKYGGYYEKDKGRLINIMAYGEENPSTNKQMNKKPTPPVQNDEHEMDRFDELQQEVAERKQFLAEMEQLGQGGKYRAVIETEISQLVREMELIDQKRTTELERILREQDAR